MTYMEREVHPVIQVDTKKLDTIFKMDMSPIYNGNNQSRFKVMQPICE